MATDYEVFEHAGHRLAYRSHGSEQADGSTLVLIHGLLMNSHMFDRLGPEMAERGNHVVCIDLLGHGESDVPGDFSLYSMTAFGEQVVGLLDHLGVERAVIGGTSLGANVSLEVAVARPDRVAGLFIEMPVLDNALVAVAVAFTPVLVASTLGAPLLRGIAAVTGAIPRTNHLLDVGLDWLRRDPRSSALVLQGLLLGRTCPPRAERRGIEAEALVVGHPSDPIHPFSDSDELVEEMRNARLIDANSILEWRFNPERLNGELAAFLGELETMSGDIAAPPRAGGERAPFR
jgi:pimeloyl-ACP methyl ester carboxylesterase